MDNIIQYIILAIKQHILMNISIMHCKIAINREIIDMFYVIIKQKNY